MTLLSHTSFSEEQYYVPGKSMLKASSNLTWINISFYSFSSLLPRKKGRYVCELMLWCFGALCIANDQARQLSWTLEKGGAQAGTGRRVKKILQRLEDQSGGKMAPVLTVHMLSHKDLPLREWLPGTFLEVTLFKMPLKGPLKMKAPKFTSGQQR